MVKKKGGMVYMTFKEYETISAAFDEVGGNIEASSDAEYQAFWEEGMNIWNTFRNKFFKTCY